MIAANRRTMLVMSITQQRVWTTAGGRKRERAITGVSICVRRAVGQCKFIEMFLFQLSKVVSKFFENI